MACSESDLLDCAQFTACPTLWEGSMPDCSKAPHVTSNSWGSTAGGDTWIDYTIEAFKAAGVIPVFSTGNSGSSCSSTGSPGDRAVIGVAATDLTEAIAYFSSRGPATGTTELKPDISAPGVEVLSSWNTGDGQYAYLSGTSMACPHVSGGVALLISAKPELAGDYEVVKKALLENAFSSALTGTSRTWGGITDTEFPNNVFGNGRLDIAASSGVV
jgi:subtilisin family serine protease